jgi:hypothetical protein
MIRGKPPDDGDDNGARIRWWLGWTAYWAGLLLAGIGGATLVARYGCPS